jgi:copper(I)-binding protein
MLAEMRHSMRPLPLHARHDLIASLLVFGIWPATFGALVSASSVAAEAAPSVQVSEAWIRWLPANVPSAGYMLLTNTGSTPRVLIGATSPAFGEIGVHQSRTVNGVTDMAPVDSLTLPPHSNLRFAPGGYHLMLMQSSRSLRAGEHVTITLRFADGPSLDVPFEVRAAGAQ